MSDEMEEFERVANGWSVFSRQCFLAQEGNFNRILMSAAPANLAMGYAWYPVLEPLAQKPEALVGNRSLLYVPSFWRKGYRLVRCRFFVAGSN